MKSPDKIYLFVYGTLRKDYGLRLMQEVGNQCVFAGHGKVKGALYDLGAYPGAVEGMLKKEIRGDVYQVTDAGVVLPVLDGYEGEDYCRKKTTVMLDSGKRIEAFIYWYTGERNKALLIEEEDYLNYLKNKKDGFL